MDVIEKDERKFKAYKRRWIYLIVVMMINFSNANTWISFSPVTFETKKFYDYANAPLFFNTVFMVLSIPVGFLACWWTDRFGIRSSCWLGAATNLAGNIVRILGSMESVDKKWRFPITFAGQCVAAFAQPFVMFLPTKLSAFWFPDDQRNIANTLASMANPLGIAAMYMAASLFVNEHHPTRFLFMNSVVGGVAVVAGVMSLAVTRNEPPTPVSASKNDVLPPPPFLEGVKRCLTSKRFIILACSLGGGVGLFNALYNNLQPALCLKGYSETFSGGMGSLLIVSGLVGAAISGIIVDKTGMFEQVMKISFALAGIAGSSLSISINYENKPWWVVASICAFGCFGFAIYPIGLELGVECTYPVAEATSTGLIIMIGQVLGVIFVVTTNLVNGTPSPRELAIQTCVTHNEDMNTVLTWKWPFVMWNCFVCAGITIFLAIFWPRYKRRAYEAARKLAVKEKDMQIEINNGFEAEFQNVKL
ncbi:unnamed protein product, partial [Mesorhabditis belari]|uniref:Major facilitator superfamily (MFS) profile domain-containing protein n=1 Tax=Mesorhabditis belari TaxID=2138241 RepID=A0AAF3ERZ5_9BILA